MDRRKFFRLTAWGMAFTCIVPRLQAIDEPSTVPIRREPVESKSIASIGFHSELRVLEIEFRSGAVYRYFEGKEGIIESMLRERQGATAGRQDPSAPTAAPSAGGCVVRRAAYVSVSVLSQSSTPVA